MEKSAEIVELKEDVSQSPYWNRDMAPVPAAGRTWGARDFLVLWVSMSACITTYNLASQDIAKGMNWWQAVLTILLGNVIVLIPMLLNAHAGTKYGIPFPVYCRASFGLLGANVPALMRALVACGWFGIQTWIGGWCIYKVLESYNPAWRELSAIGSLGINQPQLICFLAFWALNVLIIFLGINSIRFLLNIKAPILIVAGLALLAWAVITAGGWGPILRQPGRLYGPEFWRFFFPALTGAVGYWATLSLNIPDFTRYARSQRDQLIGQSLGLPTTMALFSFIGAAVTSAAVIIYPNVPQKDLWDPVILISLFDNPVVHVIALLALSLATLATNIAANVVSPANDFSNLWPQRIGFRTGGLITGLIGIAIQPWRLYNDPTGYIFTWLIGYSSLLGAIGGVLIADYFVIRKTRLDLAGLYRKDGPYWYGSGVNPIAISALILGIAPCVPGFLQSIKLIAIPEFWERLYSYAWFVSFAVSFAVYWVGTQLFSRDAESSERIALGSLSSPRG